MYKFKKFQKKTSLIWGLTGNISSGKSTVLKKLRMRGFYTINADEIVRRSYLEDHEFIEEIMGTFHTIETSQVLKQILKDEKLWQKLDNITKQFIVPKIFDEVLCRYGEFRFIIVEIPLLFEFFLQEYFDFLVLISADSAIAKKRSTKNSLVYQKFKDRQMCDDKKMENSDFIIKNNTSNHVLNEKITYLEKTIKTYV
ncbi:MAG: dephospho-CoA kinase [bacterium]|nr:dephospho-CoA kinase [bacterium]